jgi:hypothetical protein
VPFKDEKQAAYYAHAYGNAHGKTGKQRLQDMDGWMKNENQRCSRNRFRRENGINQKLSPFTWWILT